MVAVQIVGPLWSGSWYDIWLYLLSNITQAVKRMLNLLQIIVVCITKSTTGLVIRKKKKKKKNNLECSHLAAFSFWIYTAGKSNVIS